MEYRLLADCGGIGTGTGNGNWTGSNGPCLAALGGMGWDMDIMNFMEETLGNEVGYEFG